jgi:hypothetical protein
MKIGDRVICKDEEKAKKYGIMNVISIKNETVTCGKNSFEGRGFIEAFNKSELRKSNN